MYSNVCSVYCNKYDSTAITASVSGLFGQTFYVLFLYLIVALIDNVKYYRISVSYRTSVSYFTMKKEIIVTK